MADEEGEKDKGYVDRDDTVRDGRGAFQAKDKPEFCQAPWKSKISREFQRETTEQEVWVELKANTWHIDDLPIKLRSSY